MRAFLLAGLLIALGLFLQACDDPAAGTLSVADAPEVAADWAASASLWADEGDLLLGP
jgi:hypothetical protein